MNDVSLKEYIDSNKNLFLIKESKSYPGLHVLKYKRKVFHDNLWNKYFEQCRGTIVDSNFNVVAYPFQKIYNYGIESNAPVLDDSTIVTAYKKINGFMVAISCYNDDLLISTTGSTDSDFVEYAKDMMKLHMPISDWKNVICSTENKNYTFLFECVHPEDPHIIVETPGMYFLAKREVSWDSTINGFGLDCATNWKEFAESELHCFSVDAFITTIGELKELVKSVQHEGFIFYCEDGTASKLKSPYYLTLKWVARNPNTEKLTNMKNDFKLKINEEFYGLVDAIRENITEYTALSEQDRLTWVRNYFTN